MVEGLESEFEKILEPKLNVNVKGTWESYAPAAPIHMDLASSRKEEAIAHLEALSQTYQLKLKHSDTLFRTAHMEYVSFRTLQWLLIFALTTSIFIAVGFGLQQQWDFGYILLAILIPCAIILPVIHLTNVKRNKIGTDLVRYLESYHRHDPISETLLKVWSIDYIQIKTEDMDFRMEDAFKKELEEEIMRTVLHLTMNEGVGALAQDESKVVSTALGLLPTEMNQAISAVQNKELYRRITNDGLR